jgi:ribosomal protein S18 acetylase RimI-like enzyme
MEIERLRAGDDAKVTAAAALFDEAPRADAIARFLAEATHHIFVAYEDGEPAGFVTGVEMTHPDKGTEMFLYELAVDERFRRRGVGRALVDALASHARANGCYGMWVLTDRTNIAACGTYASAGGDDSGDSVMFTWEFDAGE